MPDCMSEAGINDIHAAGARTKPYARSRPRRERAGGYTPDQPGAGFLFGASYHRSMVAPEWWQIALPMVLGVAVLLLANRAFADWLSPVVALVSAGVALSARLIGRLDHAAHGTRDRMVMVAVMIVAPMFGYGWGIAHWAQVGAVPWLQALAVLVSVALIATMIQSVRLAGLLCGQVAMWAAITCVVSALGGMLAMIIGVAIGSIAYARQREIDLAEYRRLQDAAREQTRAQEILADFEETGQGWFWETDRRGMILYISAPVADLLGRTAEDLVGRPLTDLFQVEDQAAGQSGNRGERTLTFHLSARSSFSDLTVRAAVRDEERWWAITGRPIFKHILTMRRCTMGSSS